MAKRRPDRCDPAPAEIERLCAEIRTSWSELTHRVRAGFGSNCEAVAKRSAWMPPTITSSDLEIPFDRAS